MVNLNSSYPYPKPDRHQVIPLQPLFKAKKSEYKIPSTKNGHIPASMELYNTFVARSIPLILKGADEEKVE
jgi:hypothetical protein